jgi:CO/xanthine dehydrogenase Mo-binding subunit
MSEQTKPVIPEKTKKTSLSGEFYSDIEFDGMLYAALIRCPKPTGTFVSLMHPLLPEGYYVFTAKDILGSNEIPTLGVSTSIFCDGEIQYQGEPVGILAGPSEKTVHALLSEIEVITTNTETENRKIPVLAERTITTGLAQNDSSEFEKMFEKKDDGSSVVFGAWSSAISVPSYSETNGAVCIWKSGYLNVYTPTQWISHLRKTLSAALGIKSDHIRIEKTRSSNPNSNGIWRNAVFAAQAALVAYKTGKAVKLELPRQDQEQYMEKAIPVTITNRSAVSKNGCIDAMKITVDIDAGARNPFAPEILDRLVIASCGAYNIKNLSISAIAHGSRTPPSSLNINIIDSQAFFAIESTMQKISEVTGISPAELRKKNLRKSSTEPCYTPFIIQLDHPWETIDTAATMSDFARKYVTYRLDSHDRVTSGTQSFTVLPRGIGMACAFDGSGYFGTNIYTIDQSMEATMEKDGSLTLHAMPPSPSILAIWKKAAGDILKIKADDIHINSVFETEEEPQLPESVYSNLSIMTQLLRKCCESIQRKKAKMPLPITVKKGITDTQRSQWNREMFRGTPFHSTSFATAVVELELDPCTFREQVRSVNVVIDTGEILSAKSAENSIKLDINRILSRLVKDENIECTNISVQFLQSSSEPKQLHGLIQNTIPAAFSSALTQALSNTINSIPIPAEELFRQGYSLLKPVPAFRTATSEISV